MGHLVGQIFEVLYGSEDGFQVRAGAPHSIEHIFAVLYTTEYGFEVKLGLLLGQIFAVFYVLKLFSLVGKSGRSVHGLMREMLLKMASR